MGPNDQYREEFELALEAAKVAGKRIGELRERGEFTVNEKRDTSLVTTADLEADRIVVEHIRRRFPNDEILSEESAPVLSRRTLAGRVWIIDPIDGTTNYAMGHQHVAVSIAFAEGESIKAGVVECPFLRETFTARLGQGAFLNDRPIRCSEAPELRQSLIGTGFPYERPDIDELCARVRAVLLNCRDLRRVGSGAIDICWVACGRLDGFYETLNPWDIGAAALIAKEAGAVIDHLKPAPAEHDLPAELNAYQFVAANPVLLPKLKALLVEAASFS